MTAGSKTQRKTRKPVHDSNPAGVQDDGRPNPSPTMIVPGIPRADVIVNAQGQPVRGQEFPDATGVQTVSACGNTHKVVVSFDDQHFALDAQQVLAVQGLLNGLCTNLTY